MSPATEAGNGISHFSSIRMVVTGTGTFKMTVQSMDDIRTKTLVPFVMNSAIRVIPTRLVNFMEQYATFEFKTTNIDEVFKITRIVIFIKEVYTSWPGN
jgi:hypothetical protein